MACAILVAPCTDFIPFLCLSMRRTVYDLRRSCKGKRCLLIHPPIEIAMLLRKTAVSAIAVSFVLALTACQEKEGPAEKAGKELDKAAAAIGEKIESAGDKVQGAISGGN